MKVRIWGIGAESRIGVLLNSSESEAKVSDEKFQFFQAVTRHTPCVYK